MIEPNIQHHVIISIITLAFCTWPFLSQPFEKSEPLEGKMTNLPFYDEAVVSSMMCAATAIPLIFEAIVDFFTTEINMHITITRWWHIFAIVFFGSWNGLQILMGTSSFKMLIFGYFFTESLNRGAFWSWNSRLLRKHTHRNKRYWYHEWRYMMI
jgi:hypothetical protein